MTEIKFVLKPRERYDLGERKPRPNHRRRAKAVIGRYVIRAPGQLELQDSLNEDVYRFVAIQRSNGRFSVIIYFWDGTYERIS